MNPDVTETVRRLQARRDRTNRNVQIEKIEEALNSILASPDKAREPDLLERNALAQARKKLRRRQALIAENVPTVFGETGGQFSPLSALEIGDFLRRGLRPSDQFLLSAAAVGDEVGTLAERLGIPEARARERLSRARGRARAAWAAT